MLFKFNVNGVVITEVQNGVTTTLKIDSIDIQDECNAEEVGVLLKSIVDVAKTIRPNKRRKAAKKNTTVGERYHVFVTEKWDAKNNPIHEKYIYDRKDHKYMFMASSGVVIKTSKHEYSRIARAYYNKESITGLDVIESYNTNY